MEGCKTHSGHSRSDSSSCYLHSRTQAGVHSSLHCQRMHPHQMQRAHDMQETCHHQTASHQYPFVAIASCQVHAAPAHSHKFALAGPPVYPPGPYFAAPCATRINRPHHHRLPSDQPILPSCCIRGKLPRIPLHATQPA